MAPKPKAPAPAPPGRVWQRTGKCIVKSCGCELFVFRMRRDGFNECECTHTQVSHKRQIFDESGKVVS